MRGASFDQLVGDAEQRRRHGEVKHPGGLGVEDQLELAQLLDRQVCRLCALEDTTAIDTELTPRVRNVCSVAHELAGFSILTRGICRRDRVARRQVRQLETPAEKEDVGADK